MNGSFVGSYLYPSYSSAAGLIVAGLADAIDSPGGCSEEDGVALWNALIGITRVAADRLDTNMPRFCNEASVDLMVGLGEYPGAGSGNLMSTLWGWQDAAGRITPARVADQTPVVDVALRTLASHRRGKRVQKVLNAHFGSTIDQASKQISALLANEG